MSAELFNSLLKESLNEFNVKVKDIPNANTSLNNIDDIMDDNIIIENDNDNDNENENEDEDEINETEDVCLITGEPLHEKYITLSCNHSFNYIPLMKERLQWVQNYKNKGYCYSNKISMNVQTVCPYCRSVTDGILPLFDKVNGVDIEKIKWINWPKKNWYLRKKCVYKFASGKKKGECCGKGALGLFCSQHERYKDRYDENGNLIKKPKNKCKDKAMYSCMHIVSRGKRKGMCCGKKARARKQESTGFILYHCSSHYKHYL